MPGIYFSSFCLTILCSTLNHFCMEIEGKDKLDRSRDFQLLNCGEGVLETCALGRKTGSYQLGEVVIRNIQKLLTELNDHGAQLLIQSYCDNAGRMLSRFTHWHAPTQPRRGRRPGP
jgi:hypothetical protein